jgi:hypothetical protein
LPSEVPQAEYLTVDSPLLFNASQRYSGVLHIPEPHQVVSFLLKCMTEKQVGIDAELALAVSLCSGTLTDCSVLIRLHNIAEEFEVIRAMKMIRNILPAHAATNPRLALGCPVLRVACHCEIFIEMDNGMMRKRAVNR